MRKLTMGITTLLYLANQSGLADAIIVAQDYTVDSDVALESLVEIVKESPRDTANFVGDTVKFVTDETITTVDGIKSIFERDLVAEQKKAAALQTANAWDTTDDIIFRSYKVTDPVGEELTEGLNVEAGTALDISEAFSGIEFPEGTSAYYRPEFNRLFLRQTLSNIFSIEDVLAELHSAERDLMGKQVWVEAKFIEVNQSTLNELGFDWNFVDKNGGDADIFGDLFLPAGQDIFSDGLRTAAAALSGGLASPDSLLIQKTAGSLRWDLVITAMEQSTDTDVLSAPSIVTRDGSTASIVVGEERTVSTAFQVKSAESSLFIEHELEAETMGVMLEVTPEIISDTLIDLELSPKVIDLIGYETYQTSPSGSTKAPALFARMPYYRLREVQTQVTVEDGSTIGMGGLIYDKLETFKDKVPVLGSIPYIGRLFRSEGESSQKRNLMIFVSATQVDVNGRKASDLALRK